MPANTTPPRISACSVSLTGDKRIQLFPAGGFTTNSGTPYSITSARAAAIVACAAARTTPYCIDYEHASLHAAQTGNPAPAAGWFKDLEWVEGEGLFATDVSWCTRAADMILTREYQFLSPLFTCNKAGEVLDLINAGLTNTPDIDGMGAVAASLLSKEFGMPDLDDILSWLRSAFGLPTLATWEDIQAEWSKLEALVPKQGDETVAASFLGRMQTALSAKDVQVAALTRTQYDPARFVALSALEEANQRVAALTAQIQDREVEEVITIALTDGRLVGMEDWARDLAKTNLDAVKAYIERQPKIAALSRTQTGGKAPSEAGGAGGALDAGALAVCSQMGIAPEKFAATRSKLGLPG